MAIGLGAATLISGAIAGGSSIFGNILGSSSQKSVNQMNNEFNERMLQKQMDYNTEMWNKQNAYNSPVEQMKRLRAAGINPYIGMGLMNSGTAQSAGGVNPPAANNQAYRYDFSGIGQAAQTYVAQKMQEEVNQSVVNQNESIAQLNNEQAKYYGVKAIAEINEKMANASNNTQKAIWQAIGNQYAHSMFSSDALYKERQAQLIGEQVRGQLVQNAMNVVHLMHLPQKYQLEFSSLAASTALAVANKQLTEKKATTEMLGWLKQVAETEKINLDIKLFNDTFESLVEKARTESMPNNMFQLGSLGYFDLMNNLGFDVSRKNYNFKSK